MEMDFLDYSKDLYDEYNIWITPNVLGSTSHLETKNRRFTLVGAKLLEEETIKALSKVAKIIFAGPSLIPNNSFNGSFKAKYVQTITWLEDMPRGCEVEGTYGVLDSKEELVISFRHYHIQLWHLLGCKVGGSIIFEGTCG